MRNHLKRLNHATKLAVALICRGIKTIIDFLLNSNKGILLISLITTGFYVLSVYLIALAADRPVTSTISLISSAAALLTNVFALWAIILAVQRSYDLANPLKRVWRIVISYVCCILLFTGSFYWMANLGDSQDASYRYDHFRTATQLTGKGASLLPIATGKRAFSGIRSKLWLTVEDQVRLSLDIPKNADFQPTLEQSISVARLDRDKVVTFNNSAVLPVFFTSLYFSITTITTLGYGDISPTMWYTRMTAMLEVLVGIVILVVGLSHITWSSQHHRSR